MFLPRGSISCKEKCRDFFLLNEVVLLWDQNRPGTFRCDIQSFSLRDFLAKQTSYSDSCKLPEERSDKPKWKCSINLKGRSLILL